MSPPARINKLSCRQYRESRNGGNKSTHSGGFNTGGGPDAFLATSSNATSNPVSPRYASKDIKCNEDDVDDDSEFDDSKVVKSKKMRKTTKNIAASTMTGITTTTMTKATTTTKA